MSDAPHHLGAPPLILCNLICVPACRATKSSTNVVRLAIVVADFHVSHEFRPPTVVPTYLPEPSSVSRHLPSLNARYSYKPFRMMPTTLLRDAAECSCRALGQHNEERRE